jgi:flagellar motility protein MotE (MotC chaperone)
MAGSAQTGPGAADAAQTSAPLCRTAGKEAGAERVHGRTKKKAREKKLDQRAKELDAVKKEVDGKLEQIAALQKDVEEKLAAIKQEQDASFKNLIKVYSAMSPSKLGPLLNLMTDDNVAKVLRAMKAEQVALIMPKLDSEKAVKVSRLLGRFE